MATTASCRRQTLRGASHKGLVGPVRVVLNAAEGGSPDTVELTAPTFQRWNFETVDANLVEVYV